MKDTANTDAQESIAAQLNADVQTVDLDSPIPRASGAITRLTLRKPKAGALRGVALVALANIDVDALRVVLPRISEPILTAAEINEMDPRDLLAVGAAVASFFLSKAEREQLASQTT